MDYAARQYRVNYRKWLIKFISDIKIFYKEHYNHIEVDSIDTRVFEVIIQLYQQLHIFNNSHINLDLDVIKHPVCTLIVTEQNDGESLVIQSTINDNIEKLMLFRFANTTPCPRAKAFENVLEEYLGF